MAIAFPGESAEHRAERNRLPEEETELRRAMEAVAAAKRRLVPGGIVPQDYVFKTRGPGGSPAEVRLSELFAPGQRLTSDLQHDVPPELKIMRVYRF